MFEQLDLKGDEFDDLVISKDDVVIAETTRWLDVARVVCLKKLSHEALFQQMQFRGSKSWVLVKQLLSSESVWEIMKRLQRKAS
jgi:hypothetical protein